jgi:hypothetical protein
MNHYYKGAEENKVKNGVIRLIANIGGAILAFYFIYKQLWVGVILLVPILLIGPLSNRLKSDTVATLLIAFIVCQGLAIWYLASHDIFHSQVVIPTNQNNDLSKLDVDTVGNLRRDAADVIIPSAETKIEVKRKDIRKTQVFSTVLSAATINLESDSLINQVVGKMFHVEFPDLKHRNRDEIKLAHPTIFEELPKTFDPQFKNPCWHTNGGSKFVCLPYAYILGQPKCGTTDLFVRMKSHDKIM